MRNGPGGIRTLTVSVAGNCAAITLQAHEPSLLQSEQSFDLQPAFIDVEFRFGTARAQFDYLKSKDGRSGAECPEYHFNTDRIYTNLDK
jgi:hypothetical protein